MINYKLLAESLDFYELYGFKRIEAVFRFNQICFY